MPSDIPRETETNRAPTESGTLSGISELFGLGPGQAEPGTGAVSDPVGRWVAATAGTVDGSGDASGRLVHGRYRLIAELGAGGMGVTYRAWDTRAHVPVVVKMPKREVRHDRDAMTRFAREIEAMRALPHPAIVPITDSGDDSGCPFVAMRFLPGGSLADYRRRDEADRPIKNPPGMLHFWLPGVAEALDHIHARGMLHRDVKPGNIFLDGFLEPALGDFGIAKVVDESGGLAKERTLTATKMAVGTPEYMAPELFKPQTQLDGRVDQYALAVTVYEMLCGEKPFTGSTAHIIVEHSSLPVPPLERRCPGLPRSVYEAVHRALAKQPEERFATCAEFATAVLAQVPPLELEADTVRLLCPSCKNILKLPSRAAGRSGKCPRCQTVLDVAADLGSLWLESEERGGGLAVGEEADTPSSAPEKLGTQEPRRLTETTRWRADHWAALAAVAFASLAVGGLWGTAEERSRHPKTTLGLQTDVGNASESLKNARSQIEDLERRSREQEQTIAGLEKVRAERDGLVAENRRLGQAATVARNAVVATSPSPIPSRSGTSQPLPGATVLTAMQNIDGQRKDLERWGGKGQIVYGKIDEAGIAEIACYTRLWPDGSFATSLYPGRSLTFYKHGCDRLVAPLTNEVQPQVCDAGVLSFSRCPPEKLRSVRGTVSRSSVERDSIPTRVSLSIRNNDPVWNDWGHGGARLSVGVDSSAVQPGGSFAFEGLSRIPYFLSLTCPNYVARDIEIDMAKDGVIDLGNLVLEKAPVIDIRYRARLRPKGKVWSADKSVQSTSVVCDGRSSFTFTDMRDSYGNTLALRMSPKPEGVVASFFYHSGGPFFDLGQGDITTLADFDATDRRPDAPGKSEMSLEHGHVYLFKIAHMEGTDIELFFQTNYH